MVTNSNKKYNNLSLNTSIPLNFDTVRKWGKVCLSKKECMEHLDDNFLLS